MNWVDPSGFAGDDPPPIKLPPIIIVGDPPDPPPEPPKPEPPPPPPGELPIGPNDTPQLVEQEWAAAKNLAIPDTLGLPPSVVGTYAAGANQTVDFSPSAETTAQGPNMSLGDSYATDAALTLLLGAPYLQAKLQMQVLTDVATLLNPDASGAEKAVTGGLLVLAVLPPGRLVGGIATEAGPVARAVARASAAAESMLIPGGQRLGAAGSRETIRELPGGAQAAGDFFRNLFTQTGAYVEKVTASGVVARVPGGGYIGFRGASRSGPPTIDINIPGIDILKIKFK